ncbi:MAG: NADH:ubiquinone reductase (Na(+)-transporting) subunit C [Flavobacteriales bacterium]|nr:NADH:ubiquinone reductase (Na(+)-transporting) subunit C [Flavobacteriales bacterium]|tara:strand:- start:22 stop:741 length:720 start_codon:yes stop_codon:yes gene_type:complete
MAFNKDSNIFTFVFAISMCVLVAGVLAGTFSILQTDIKYNQSAKNMVDLLSAIEVDSSRETAEIDFDKYITGFVVLNSQGNKIDSLSNKSSALSIDIKKQYRDKTIKLEDKKFPLFIAEKDNQSFYIAPLIGTGLWGPIWGFVSFNEDGNTVTGASFDHKSETPGLGAEIREDFFEKQFIGQKILDSEGIFVSIAVMKGGANIDSYHEVDGITGGTITSDGVTDMLYENLSIYSKYLNK